MFVAAECCLSLGAKPQRTARFLKGCGRAFRRDAPQGSDFCGLCFSLRQLCGGSVFRSVVACRFHRLCNPACPLREVASASSSQTTVVS